MTAREVAPGANAGGVQVTLDGAGDKATPCNPNTNPLCDGVRLAANGTVTGKYNHYTIEAVQRIGADSFTPAQGVLISKTKDNGSSCGTFTCFVWIIDAHPQDINRLDFIKPDGTPQMVTIADPRQLNDAPFNAGTNSGSEYEYVDEDNRLHFYVLDVRKDARRRRALQGRGALAGRRGPADARRAALDAGAGHRRRLRDLHVRADQHGRGGGDAERAPAGRLGVPGRRRLPAARDARAAPAGRRSCATRWRRRSSARRSRCRCTSPRAPAPAR